MNINFDPEKILVNMNNEEIQEAERLSAAWLKGEELQNAAEYVNEVRMAWLLKLALRQLALNNPRKLTVYSTDAHDHTEVMLDGQVVCSNDYSVENLYRLAQHLGWEVETIQLTGDEFEERFA